ncbi:RNA-directed DNA polymerase, eukaryota [Tanacetum coccineum]|uniref:RNA-directed DNA polymerase, eukaryota n=1 Tax=Tanacetum coccineum TaxID=301880 RepID=A0ABQ4ZAC1_9ASTR
MDVFAWEPADMPGIPRRIIEHSLNVNPLVEPVAQKRRVMAYDRTQVVSKEVEEWVSAGIVRPVRYPTWISNPVLVKKGDGSWRMCIDFKNVNSACPKDYYPLPDIDGKIESVVGFRYKCFLDAYKGYHQVQMAQDDEEKTVCGLDKHHYMPSDKISNRPLANKSRTFDSKTDKSRINSFGNKVNNVVNEISSSYAYVAKGGSANNEEKDSIPSRSFDDTNEGFGDIVLRYLGGIPIKLWTSNSFKKIASKWGLYLNEEMTEEHSYHSKRLCILTKRLENIYETVKITYQGKIYWIRAKEISGWIPEFEEQNEDESDMDSEQLDEGFQTNFDGNEDDKLEDDDLSAVPDTVHSEEKKEGDESVDRNQIEENKYADPFRIYELLKMKRCNDNRESSYKESLEFPPGFTPREEGECEDFVHGSNASVEVNSVKSRDNLNKSTGVEFVGSDHFHKVEIPRSGGSILNLMEEVVKVGQTMGFKMDGCIKNIEDIVEGQGVDDETKMESIELFDIKRCWGNFAFDYVYSESSGNSGGILCVWNPNAFSKSSVTVSDYFIITRGVWRSNGKSMLIISVYAPQEISEKKSLWNYLNHVVNNWKGEAIIMGDFNEAV